MGDVLAYTLTHLMSGGGRSAGSALGSGGGFGGGDRALGSGGVNLHGVVIIV